MRHQSRYIDTRLDNCKFIAIQNNSYRTGFFVILNQLLEFYNEIKSYQKESQYNTFGFWFVVITRIEWKKTS
jgi:hypothetical protein